MDKRLQKLQTRVNVLRELVTGGIPPELSQVLTCEVLVSELREEHEFLAREFKSATSPAMKKLGRDFAKLSPLVTEVLAKASQACFDARFEIEAVNRKDSEEKAGTSKSNQDTESQGDAQAKARPQQRQKQVLLEVEQDEAYTKEIEKELKRIELQAQSVRSLTENVATMVAHQADDAMQVSRSTSYARDNVVAGLGELAEAKKKEAGKHTTRSTTVSAVIGGAVGLVGGPIGVALGAAAGAAVGAAIGSSIAGISRRSIDREVRTFKEKFRVEIRSDGACATYAEVFEHERWSLNQKTWSSDSLIPTDYRTRWALDELGTPLGPNDPSPLYPDLPPKAPGDKGRGYAKMKASLSPVGQSVDLLEEEAGGPIEGLSDSAFSGTWRWAQNSKWMPDMSNRNADVNGWQYAFSFAEGAVWYPQPNRTSFVRRRRWIRDQILDPQKAHHPERIALIAMERKRDDNEVPTRMTVPISHTESMDKATRNLGQSVQASQATLEELRRQGVQINDAAYDVAIAEDASIHAQRVARAVTMTGAFQNVFSNAPDAAERAVVRRMNDEARSERTARMIAVEAERTRTAAPVGWDHPVDVLGQLAHEQLTMSQVIHAEVTQQNKQLDVLAEATARGERRILRAKDMI